MPLSNQRKAQLMGGSYITKLRDHEELLGKLYTAFASAFPGQKRFWESIATEEMYHQRMVETLDKKVKAGDWGFQRPTYLYGHITESIEWITRLIHRIEDSGMTVQEALHVALTAERSIIETNYMDFVMDDDPDAVRILNTLRNETENHIKKIDDEANKLKWRFFGKRKRTAATHTLIESTDAVAEAMLAQKDILQCLVALEENLSTLYNTYRIKLKDHEAFWGAYVSEELQHAAMIKSLFSYLEKGHLFKNIGAFNKEQLIQEIEYVLEAEYNARHKEITMAEALNTALKLETMLSESSFYGTVSSSAPEYDLICTRMTSLIATHKQRLHDKIIELGRQQAPKTEIPPLPEQQ